MSRQRAASNASTNSSHVSQHQELGSMYDYLAKIVLLGPSGCGKSCVLHRFVKEEWRVLSSQTIGVEFASKIVKVGTGARRKRIKLQLWDTAGTERFRSVSRSYYRGAAGAILIYDVASLNSFNALPTFLNDARALASPNLTVLLAGNKCDLGDETAGSNGAPLPPRGLSSKTSTWTLDSQSSVNTQSTITTQGTATGPGAAISSSFQSGISIPPPRTPTNTNSNNAASTPSRPTTAAHQAQTPSLGTQSTLSTSLYREVPTHHAQSWATTMQIPYALECSAFTGENIDELFERLALVILTKIELGEINPDDPASGIQYGDSGGWWAADERDGASVKSGLSGFMGNGRGVRRRGNRGGNGGLSEWDEVFRGGRRGRCC